MLGLADNIVKYRHERNITQSELARFLGVTKASVSKWETRQSYPDIMLLPKLASYFDVSIDELIGYEPKLEKEHVNKLYEKLAEEFASKEFEKVIEHVQDVVKTYYSSYYLVSQMAILLVNHYMLAPEPDRQHEILKWAITLLEHVNENCGDMVMCRDAIIMKAVCNLQLGRTNEVIEQMKSFTTSDRMIMRADTVLVKAYQMSGDLENADLYSQVSVYTNLMELISDSVSHLGIHIQDYDYGVETIKRLENLVNLYDVERLNSNLALQVYYQAAYFYCMHGFNKEALDYLEMFVDGSVSFLNNGISLHGDDYFSKIEEWNNMQTKNPIPRNEKVIRDSLLSAVQTPAFAVLEKDTKYKILLKKLK